MQPRRSPWRHRLVAIVLVLAGAVLSVFPVAENFYQDWQGLAVVDDYTALVEAAPQEVLDRQRTAAQEYNDSLHPSVLNDPWSDEQPATSAEHDAYVSELQGFGPLGRIRLPSVGIDLPIYHDATRYSLGLGAGHMYGTSLPVGGVGTHSVIAGHTGATIRTYFNRLNEAVEGDLIHIDTLGETLTYRIDQIQVVSRDDLSQIQPIEGADLVTLVTCIVGHQNDRLLVRGVRYEPGPAATASTATPDAGSAPKPAQADLRVQEWMLPRLALGGGALLLVMGMSIHWVISDARTRPSLGARVQDDAPRRAVREDALL